MNEEVNDYKNGNQGTKRSSGKKDVLLLKLMEQVTYVVYTTNYMFTVHHVRRKLKRGFHETTKINRIDHRCIQIDPWVLETSRHRPMDIGAILAAD